MLLEQINLYDYYKLKKPVASKGELTVYCRSDSVALRRKIRPAVLVVPGGGYQLVSDREGEPIALSFLNEGYVSFVLDYTVQTPYPTVLNEALMAVAFIRQNAEKYGIDKEQVVAIGFSAGAHLVGMLATATENELNNLKGKAEKPNIVILSYPVVTMGEFAHEGSKNVISDKGKIDLNLLSVEKRVNANTVPAFIWHTYEDQIVPMENSLLLANAYRKANIPFALHIFEKGWHGLSLSNEETSNQTPADIELKHIGKWFEIAIDWLCARGIKVKNS